MITKTYESPNSVIANWTLIVNGRPRILNFTAISVFEGSRTGHGSILTTSDPVLQNAIEHSRLYGGKIRLLKSEESSKEELEVSGEELKNEESGVSSEELGDEPKEVVVPTTIVDSPNEAREYMHNNYGIEMRKMPNLKAITNAAKEHGVIFECLKK